MEGNSSRSIAELAAALSKAQAQMDFAKKDSSNPYFKSKYADLTAVWDAIRKPLTDNGLSITQLTKDCVSGDVVIETVLLHESGEWIKSAIAMKPVDTKPQSIGSCITYARRYSLSSIVGCVGDIPDDDGNVASGKVPQEGVPKLVKKVPQDRYKNYERS